MEQETLRNRHPEAILASAKTGFGMDELTQRVEKAVNSRLEEMEVLLPAGEGRLLAEVGESCVILAKDYVDGHVRMRLRVPKRQSWKLEPYRSQS